MTKFHFQGGDIVRLRAARGDLAAGCCGIVWGVYDQTPPLYEATFVDEHGESADTTFESEDVDQLADVDVAPFSERLAEIRRTLNSVRQPDQ